ncbi:MAG: hypothetical protein RLZZ292_1499 [Bacteroidota bacterium]|jgi:hypothetical protein
MKITLKGKLEYIIGLVIVFCLLNKGFGQELKHKELVATNTTQNLRIDGKLDEKCWQQGFAATDFIQIEPMPGIPAKQRTEVKVLYDNRAIYIGAKLHDTDAAHIPHELTPRDQLGNTDWFAVVLSPYLDGQNGFGFFVTPDGVQLDTKYIGAQENNAWDAVWSSSAHLTTQGWEVEIEIPYSAIRFPKEEIQKWGINFKRNVRRTREQMAWNEIKPEINNPLIQCGYLKGIKELNVPLRLSATPFIAANGVSKSNTNQARTVGSGGMDLKYGINNAFTLDISLIPDFEQAQSDNQVLNLSAYEVRYDENRQFFTEGMELFQKGKLFYSRRIGGTPYYYNKFKPNPTNRDLIVNNPSVTPILNITKLSGRTANGTGIGWLNATVGTTQGSAFEGGNIKFEETNPLTNYNVLVVDQNLKNNSSLTFINATTIRKGKADDSNVTGTEFNFKNKKNTYGVNGGGALSQRFLSENKNQLEHRVHVGAGKISGKFQCNIDYNEESTHYNPNDLGLLYTPNERTWQSNFAYYRFKPFGKFNRFNTRASITYSKLYQPDVYNLFNMTWSTSWATKKFFSFGTDVLANPIGTHDYIEPRTREFSSFFAVKPSLNVGTWISSDYRKKLALDLRLSHEFFKDSNQKNYSIRIAPRVRASNHLSFVLENTNTFFRNEPGWVAKDTASVGYKEIPSSTIVFGIRDRYSVENILTAKYIVNNHLSFSLRTRHYLSSACYQYDFKSLERDGSLIPTRYLGREKADNLNTALHNKSYNSFNMDLVGTWRFAPGSDLFFIWKNTIFHEKNATNLDWEGASRQLFEQEKHNNFSLKAVFYLDYSKF